MGHPNIVSSWQSHYHTFVCKLYLFYHLPSKFSTAGTKDDRFAQMLSRSAKNRAGVWKSVATNGSTDLPSPFSCWLQ